MQDRLLDRTGMAMGHHFRVSTEVPAASLQTFDPFAMPITQNPLL